jgi:hypothetical protein
LPLLREHPLQGPDPIVQLFDQRGGCCVMPFVMPIVMPCVREVNVAPSLPPAHGPTGVGLCAMHHCAPILRLCTAANIYPIV